MSGSGARDAKSLLITGGGTGGHVFPALAVAREWLRRAEKGERTVVFVGTERGMEARLVPQAGLPLETIRVAGLKGIGGAKFYKNVALLPAGLLDSEKILRRHHFGAAFGVGGYASGPMMLLAALHGVPTVVFAGAGDPVATGLVESWAHPGGVVTGISDVAATLTVKRLELLKAFSPGLKRVAMLWNMDDRAMTLRYQASAATAQTQGLVVEPLGVREPDDFNGAFAAMERDKPDAILMVADALTVLNRRRVIEFAAAHRLPAIYEVDFFARDGGLMSYGADERESLTRAASMIDRIFKGAKPGDIPFEQPTRYLFVINLKTAKALGLEPPMDLLARADEVIE